MERYLNLFNRFFRATTMANLAYKADFIAWSLVTIGWFIWNIAFYQLLFLQVDQIAGWSKGQVLVLQGFYWLTEFVIWGLIYANVSRLPTRISHGQLDRDIIKPANLQFLLSFQEFNQNQLHSIVLGFATIIYGMKLLSIPWSLSGLIFASIIFLVGCVFLYGAYFSTVCLAFWFDRLENVVYLFPETRAMSKVPFTAYTGIAKIAFTFVIPVALVTAIPSQFLFGEPNWPLAGWLVLMSLIVLWFSHLMLKWGLRRYASASS